MMPMTSISPTNPATGSSLHFPNVNNASSAESMLRKRSPQTSSRVVASTTISAGCISRSSRLCIF